jgi:hypothetical protein
MTITMVGNVDMYKLHLWGVSENGLGAAFVKVKSETNMLIILV